MATTVDTLLVEIRAETRQLKKGLDKVNRQLEKTKKSSVGVSNALKMVGGALAGIGFGKAIGSTISTIRTFEDLEATLTAITGSAKTAAISFDLIREFTSQTTFQLENVSQAFISLLQAGVTPTSEALTDFGNLAAAFGKDISQVAQATFRAVTGEMEMLKQFNVVARLEGDKVRATFAGVTTEFDRNGKAIAEYLQSIGRANFSTATADRANTLTGAISNASDGLAEFQVAIGEGGLKDALIALAREFRVVIDQSKPIATLLGKTLSGAFTVLGKTILFALENLKFFIAALSGVIAVAGINLIIATFTALILKVQMAILAVMTFQGVTIGPAGIAKVVAGAAAASVAFGVIHKGMNDFNKEAKETTTDEDLIAALSKPIPFMDRLGKKTKDAIEFLKEFGVVAEDLDHKIRNLGKNGSIEALEQAIKAFTDENIEIAFPVSFVGPVDIRQFKADMRKIFFEDEMGASEDDVLRRIGLMSLGDVVAATKNIKSAILKHLDPQGMNIFKELLNDDAKLEEFFKNAGGEAAFFGQTIDEVRTSMQGIVDDSKEVSDTFMQTLAPAIQSMSLAFSASFTNALLEGQAGLQTFKDFAKNIVSQIISIFLQMAVVNKILNAIFGTGGFDVEGWQNLATMNIRQNDGSTSKALQFQPKFSMAGGGNIQGGRPTLVGERGAEIFIPNTGGTLMNNMNSKNASGEGTTVINQSINFATGIIPTVRAEVMQMMPQIADVTKAAVQEAAMRGGNFRRSIQGG